MFQYSIRERQIDKTTMWMKEKNKIRKDAKSDLFKPNILKSYSSQYRAYACCKIYDFFLNDLISMMILLVLFVAFTH